MKKEDVYGKSSLIGSLLFWSGAVTIFISLLAVLFFKAPMLTSTFSIIGGIAIAGFGEIIILLQKIYINTKKD
ncbi:hypothetical protein [Paenibacillus agricola]|nr:hypothetical protein [Paenibacillus agricola]